MRMRVGRDRRAVGGPARVRDAGAAGNAVARSLLVQVGHARHAARAPQRRISVRALNRHAARVIAAILEPPQTFNQDRNNVAVGNRTDDAAHIRRL